MKIIGITEWGFIVEMEERELAMLAVDQVSYQDKDFYVYSKENLVGKEMPIRDRWFMLRSYENCQKKIEEVQKRLIEISNSLEYVRPFLEQLTDKEVFNERG